MKKHLVIKFILYRLLIFGKKKNIIRLICDFESVGNLRENLEKIAIILQSNMIDVIEMETHFYYILYF